MKRAYPEVGVGEVGDQRSSACARPLDRSTCLIRANAIQSMTGETYRAVGLRGPEIVAVSTEPVALDDLAGSSTIVTDARDLTVLPALATRTST